MTEKSSRAGEKTAEDDPVPGIKRVVTDHGNKAQRLLRVDQIYSRKDRQVHFVKTAKTKSKPDRFGKTALVVRRIISSKGMVADTEIDVKSEHLARLLKEKYDGITGFKLNKSPPVADPRLLFWAYPFLLLTKENEKAKSDPDQSLINDIGTALRFVDEDLGDKMSNQKSLLAEKQITYDLLWTIFPPKEVCLAPSHGMLNQKQAMHLEYAEYGERPNRTRYFGIEGSIITHDGEAFGRGNLTIEINEFDGAKPLSSLPLYPLRYHDNEKDLREALITRGKKYITLLKTPTCQEYTSRFGVKEGSIVYQGEKKLERTNVKGRIMVDPETYGLHNGWSKMREPYVFAHGVRNYEDLTDSDYMVCAYWLNGFSLTHKTWCQMAVEDMADVDWNRDAFKKLVIDEERRDIIHGLVKSHRNDESTFDDIIADKGQGLVGLLTGSPGVGKTLTAEAVAEVTQRPLYTVSSGELGTDADTVDQRLEVILDITRRWGCVLLMDEADVFLAARGYDMARNSLVSVFLRRLEYFRGVCMLTTNRRSEIDPAFQSRIHFTIHYPSLDEAARKGVWSNFISTIGKSTEKVQITDGDIELLSQHVLNGRQIKNIVACAVSLSREKQTPITVSEIEKLISILIN